MSGRQFDPLTASPHFQVEVTFNFLEIRAMNTYPEHQVWRISSAPSYRLKSNYYRGGAPFPPTGCHRHRQDYVLAETADAGAAGSCGQPYQLRSLPGLPQLYLCVSLHWKAPVFGRFCVLGRKREVGRLLGLACGLASFHVHAFSFFCFFCLV